MLKTQTEYDALTEEIVRSIDSSPYRFRYHEFSIGEKAGRGLAIVITTNGTTLNGEIKYYVGFLNQPVPEDLSQCTFKSWRALADIIHIDIEKTLTRCAAGVTNEGTAIFTAIGHERLTDILKFCHDMARCNALGGMPPLDAGGLFKKLYQAPNDNRLDVLISSNETRH